jgi:hypothetical protein
MQTDAKALTAVTTATDLPLERASPQKPASSVNFSAILRSVQGEQQADLQERFSPRTNLRQIDTLATLGSGLGGKVLEQDPTVVDRLQADYEAKLAAFNQAVGTLFREEGIQQPDNVSFRQTATGRLQVIGDHPDKKEITNLLAENPGVGDLFTEMSEAQKAVTVAKDLQQGNGVGPRFSVLFDGLRTQMEFERRAISGGAPSSTTSVKA